MLQVLARESGEVSLRPAAVGEIAAYAQGEAPIRWIDLSDPAPGEVDAIADALAWPDLLREAVADREDRQRTLRVGAWGVATLRSPTGRGVGLLAVSGPWAVTIREAWTVDFGPSLADLGGWPDPESAGGMAIACVLLSRLIEVYEDESDGLEDRLVAQEASLLEASKGRDPLPALRETAALRGAVGDLRRRSSRLREVLGSIIRQELVDRRHGEAVDLELRDIYDHLLRVHDDLDAYGERLIALQDARLSLVAYRQNDITKRISGWGAVLLVPTVTTGWYGQNFAYLPLLDSPAGPAVWLGVTVVGAVALALVLRKANWL